MNKCKVCGHTQEEAGEHCGQLMEAVGEGAPDQSAPSGPATPSGSSDDTEDGSAV